MAANGVANLARQCRFWKLRCCPIRLILLYGLVNLLIVCTLTLEPPTHVLSSSIIGNRNRTGRICTSVDIRNSFPVNDSLKGCTVVEGFVQILLFDNVNETEMATKSYPELTEITDYLLLYRVNGLRSIGQLFPNLAVIRGQTLFYSFALIIFEMSSLQEIGLYSLTDITHGLVRIDKNPSLCFVHSIDWERISHENGEHFIRSSKPDNECPICPGEKSDREPNNTVCPKATKTDNNNNNNRDQYLCWNRQNCQIVCPAACSSCNRKGECCNELCIGGCSDNDVNDCKVCRDYSMDSGDKRQCMFSCPPNFYKFLGRRCVSYHECINTRTPIELSQSPENKFPYKIFNHTCILNCPNNYMDDYANHTCKPCAGRCKKECPGVNVDSINVVQQLKGCTHINGPLEIQIRGGRMVVNELEENLSMIEEISGYLKVVRSFPLVSLSFLRNLKRIGGTPLESNKYVIVVLDNQNLQDLWNWENRTLEIGRKDGLLFFHLNPKLCIDKIKMLQQKAHLSNFTDQEVARSSNGDKIACNVTILEVEITSIVEKSVLLRWTQFAVDDHRKLLGYIVYSIAAPNKNVSLYDGRDACAVDNWRVDDVPVPDVAGEKCTHLLTKLMPYTQYAFYVKTYTIASETKGAISNIQYFRTLPSRPTVPKDVKVTSNASDALKIVWTKPENPNGHITHYIVTGKRHMIDSEDRNYCKDPPTAVPKPQLLPHDDTTNSFVQAVKNTTKDKCDCKKKEQQTSSRVDEPEQAARIKFEDALQNQVYHKRVEVKTRKKRDSPAHFPYSVDLPPLNNNNTTIYNLTDNATNLYISFNFPVYEKTEFYLPNLFHFTEYDIKVQACRQKTSKELNKEEDANNSSADDEINCSRTGVGTGRTQMKAGADNISKVQIKNQSLDSVTIEWDQPISPNGLILSITLEYKNVDQENTLPFFRCITLKDIKNGTMIYTIDKLNSGNYSLRILATSSAGPGLYSPITYFFIKESSSNGAAVYIGVPALIVFIVFGILAYLYMRHRQKKDSMQRLIPWVNPDYQPSVYVPDEWEVPRKNIELLKELGQGSFGMVYEGVASDIRGKTEIRCAIKTVNEHATDRERLEFLIEASVMKAFDTAHVVRLLGVVSEGQPTLVIMELMANGDLKSYLRSHRPDTDAFDQSNTLHPPSLKQIYQMAIEIADGMSYLSAKKFVHRDLAARNCMVAEDLTVKIGDFGMTRDIYETDYYRKGTKGLLPVRWMAPESLKDGVFSSSSDVWSYGVVLWEMATLASQPYQGLSNDQVLRYVIDGGVMERPENCPDKLYTLMRYCWQHKPTSRPSFLELCTSLLKDASTNFPHVSFYHSTAGMEARSSRPTPSPSQDDQTTPLRKAEGIRYSDSQESDSESDINTNMHIQFPSISDSTERVNATANGYVSGCPTNGPATTQC